MRKWLLWLRNYPRPAFGRKEEFEIISSAVGEVRHVESVVRVEPLRADVAKGIGVLVNSVLPEYELGLKGRGVCRYDKPLRAVVKPVIAFGVKSSSPLRQ